MRIVDVGKRYVFLENLDFIGSFRLSFDESKRGLLSKPTAKVGFLSFFASPFGKNAVNGLVLLDRKTDWTDSGRIFFK